LAIKRSSNLSACDWIPQEGRRGDQWIQSLTKAETDCGGYWKRSVPGQTRKKHGTQEKERGTEETSSTQALRGDNEVGFSLKQQSIGTDGGKELASISSTRALPDPETVGVCPQKHAHTSGRWRNLAAADRVKVNVVLVIPLQGRREPRLELSPTCEG